MFTIKAPNAEYSRKLFGVQFVDGAATTDDTVAAAWFSGRNGFEVSEAQTKGAKEEKPKK